MNKYYVLGGDGKEYGPVEASEIRQWIAEGRLNAQSQVRAESATEWTAVNQLAEFAGAARAAGPATPPLPGAAQAFASPAYDTGAGRAVALGKVSGPAIALIVTGALGILLSLVSVLMHVLGSKEVPPGLPPQLDQLFRALNGPVGLISDVIGLAVSALIVFGALKMKKLESHGLAIGISVVAMLPCVSPCCILGIPFGIWALVVLNKAEVKSQFS